MGHHPADDVTAEDVEHDVQVEVGPLRRAQERRDQRTHPAYTRPELLATRPSELWSWDITKLLGPRKWTYYYLYVILDVFSRFVVGWMVAHRESATLAERFIHETCGRRASTAGSSPSTPIAGRR